MTMPIFEFYRNKYDYYEYVYSVNSSFVIVTSVLDMPKYIQLSQL